MKLFYIVKNLRLKEAFGFLAISLFTFLLSIFLFNSDITTEIIIKSVIVLFIYLIFALSWNNYCDRKNDTGNPEKIKINPIASNKLSKRLGLATSSFLFILGFSLTAIWLPSLFWFYSLIMLNVFLYSWKFKKIYFLDLISHNFYVSSLFLFPAFVIGLNYVIILYFMIILFLISTITEIENEINDFEYDKKSGMKTTAIKFGIGISRNLYYVCHLIILSLLLIFIVSFSMWQILVLFPFIFVSTIRINNKFAERIYGKFSVITAMIFSLSFLL